MKIGIFYPTLNVCGGAEFVTVVMANALARQKQHVILFTNDRVSQPMLESYFGESLNPSVKSIPQSSLFNPRGLLDFYQTFYRTLALKLRCDVLVDVYSNCVFPWGDVSYVHFPFLNSSFYTPRFPYWKSRHLLQMGALPYVAVEKNAVSYEDKLVLANSRYTADEIKRFSGKQATVLYPPVPSAFFKHSPSELEASRRENLVVTISRFGPDKGLEKIPQIAARSDPTVHFAIVGRTHDLMVLQTLKDAVVKLGVQDRVKFFTDLPMSQMEELLLHAKVYLHTMVGEHFGISTVQAMALGCLPVVHDSGGAREFVEADLRYRTVEEAAETVAKVLAEWSPRETLKQAAKADRFKEQNFAQRFLALFDCFVSSRTRRNSGKS